jgi:hypothetical protein
MALTPLALALALICDQCQKMLALITNSRQR